MRSVAGSSWLIGVLVALAAWNVTLGYPTQGLDPSWLWALNNAAHRGMHFGTSIVFTYGPLGFLGYPILWYSGLATVAFIYQAALHVLLAVTLVFALRELLGLVVGAVVAFVIILAAPAADVPTVLAVAWCVTALSSDPPPFAIWVVTIGGAVLGAIETLVEARPGPVIVGISLITLVAVERRRRQLPIFLGILLVVGAGLWFASGQSLANLPDYVTNELQIVSGYSEAMGFPPNARIWLAIPILIGVVAGAVALTGPRRGRRVAVGLVVGLAGFALFKEGFVRADIGHTPIFFGSMLVLVAAARPLRDRRSVVLLAALALLLVVNVGLRPRPPLSQFNPVTNANQAFTQVRTLSSARRLDIIRVFSGAFMAAVYRLPPSDLALLKGHTVHLNPWDTAAAWVYHLNWDPAPVFQGYSAYTSTLDELNAHALRAASGPQRILRENTNRIDPRHGAAGIDGRLGVWDPPAEATATMCNFAPLQTSARWQVLARVPDRCGPGRLLKTVSAQPGQTISIPAVGAGQALIGRVHGLAVSGVERLETLLFRAHERHALINGTLLARIVPGTAQDGLLFSLSPQSDYPAPFRLSPDVRTISFTGGSGPLRIDLIEMSVSRTPSPQALARELG